MRILSSLLGAGVLALGLNLAGCGGGGDGADPVVVVPAVSGTLTVTWTIEGFADPALCAPGDAFELVLYDEFGDFYTEVEAPCESFFLSMDLDEGLYFADATLVDFDDQPVTTTATLDDIDIFAEDELVIDLDFPAESFL